MFLISTVFQSFIYMYLHVLLHTLGFLFLTSVTFFMPFLLHKIFLLHLFHYFSARLAYSSLHSSAWAQRVPHVLGQWLRSCLLLRYAEYTHRIRFDYKQFLLFLFFMSDCEFPGPFPIFMLLGMLPVFFHWGTT